MLPPGTATGEPGKAPGDTGVLVPFTPAFVRAAGSLLQSLIRRSRPAARGARRGRRRRTVANPTTGRNIRLAPYRPAENLLAPLPTVLEAVRNQRPRAGSRLRIERADLRGWSKAERESLTLILLVDVSRSTVHYVGVFAELLRSLASHFQRNRDRMGLVSIQGRQAVVLHHPTHNYRIVTRHLARLTFRGETPLGDGLQKALTVGRMERFKNPGSQSLVMLLSDCCPEPILPGEIDPFDQPAYRDARVAAAHYARDAVQLLVLQVTPPPAPLAGQRRGPTPGDRLAEALVAASRGRLLRLPHREDGRLSRRQLDRVLVAVESMFDGGARGAMDWQKSGQAGMTPDIGR